MRAASRCARDVNREAGGRVWRYGAVFFGDPARGASCRAAVAQLVECVLGKDEVTGSIPVSS